jgi:hypothetical protein
VVEEIVQQILSLFRNQEMMQKLALAAEFKIKKRTQQGIAVEGTSFGQYSPGYAKKRTKAGLPIHPITLTFDDITGMLQQITDEVSSDYKSVEIFIQKPEKELIMQYLSIMGAGRNRKIFHFWDISEQEEKELAEIVDEELLKNFSLIKGSVL